MDIKILQLSRDNRSLMFERWDRVKDIFDINNYKVIYKCTTDNLGMSPLEKNVWIKLETIFEIFNIRHPKDFHGHSLSTSDVVKLDDEYYYCNSFGFINITDKV